MGVTLLLTVVFLWIILAVVPRSCANGARIRRDGRGHSAGVTYPTRRVLASG